jgi:hypothetical protein
LGEAGGSARKACHFNKAMHSHGRWLEANLLAPLQHSKTVESELNVVHYYLSRRCLLAVPTYEPPITTMFRIVGTMFGSAASEYSDKIDRKVKTVSSLPPRRPWRKFRYTKATTKYLRRDDIKDGIVKQGKETSTRLMFRT